LKTLGFQTFRSGDPAAEPRGILGFRQIRDSLQELEASADFSDFLARWLPERQETELLFQEVQNIAGELENPQQLLEKLSEVISRPDVPLDVAEVRIMSLHKSKGLSAPYVFVAGCVEGLLPGQVRSPATPAERAAKLEEDRRLFYVGITRVKADPPDRLGYLAITYPQRMPVADAARSNIIPVRVRAGVAELQPSRFIAEMAPHVPRPEFNAPL